MAGAVFAGVLAWPGPSAAARDGELWGTATIAPGREGIVEVAGSHGAAPGATLTLTAPRGARVTATPLDAPGYLGRIAADGRSGTYTVAGDAAGQAWQGRTFPFVLAVPDDAVPGTRLRDCVLLITDVHGVRQEAGRCTVTVGLTGPTLTRPLSGVPLDGRPPIAGTAHAGARITVREKDDREACATTAAPDGTWSCTPGPAFPAGANRLQAVATLNGVSAMSEQIDISVADAGSGQ
ncbi:carboxypeptidase regulatory-like domain-containing protein [Streptomyces sp. DH10]|uniref:carboxypeptidase regulatory-like domain-containing protein n=1 Tax=Streptomyces sp. DH10 TaxID=3040121 RepID=UPI0024426ED8|nr:carboxypeptidase regulatory-like domain-containing protein [Streptomyces sp. DH10]MDG9714762.1 carboxypeptidase regulatory-like domain-containing protein [Streptomyces sp. DH10]